LCKLKLNDFKGALVDFTVFLEMDEESGDSYYFRGICKSKLGDKNGACLDLKMARELGTFKATDEINKSCK